MTGYGIGGFGSGPFGVGGGIVGGSVAVNIPAAWCDRYGFGPYGRRYHSPVALVPTLYPDRYGLDGYGRRYHAPIVPTGQALTQTCYLTIGHIGCSGGATFTEAGELPPAVATVLPALRAPIVYVLDDDRHPTAVIDGYESLEWQERWREPDEWSLSVNMHVAGATALATGTYIAVPLDTGETLVGLIEGLAGGVSEDGIPSEIVTATGRDYGATLEGRLAMMETASGDGYDTFGPTATPAEAGRSYWMRTGGTAAEAMCHYVWRNVIGDAYDPAGWRVVPDLAIGIVPATAETVSYRARYQPLTEILADIGLSTGLGWRVRYDATDDDFKFEPLVGRDMTDAIAFSPEYGNIASIGFSHDTRNERSVAVVAGQGEGADRETAIVYDPARNPDGYPSGLAVREVFVDARDAQSDDDRERLDLLYTRGHAKLAEAGPEQSIEFALLDGGAYEYPRDFQNGDVVRVEYPDWAYEESRIVAVAQRWDSAGKAVQVTVGSEPRDVGSVLVGLSRNQGVRSRT